MCVTSAGYSYGCHRPLLLNWPLFTTYTQYPAVSQTQDVLQGCHDHAQHFQSQFSTVDYLNDLATFSLTIFNGVNRIRRGS